MKTLAGIVLGFAAAAATSYYLGGREGAAPRPDAAPTVAPPQAAAVAMDVPAAVAEGTAAPLPGPSQAQRQWRQFSTTGGELRDRDSVPFYRCFRRSAASHGVPEALLVSVARGESGFDPAARSDRNAIGVMQILWPDTAQHLGIHRERDLYDACTSIDAGARYLAELIERYGGDLHLAVAAYNYGPARVAPGAVPALAQQYSEYILEHLAAIGGIARAGNPASDTQSRDEGQGRLLLLRFNDASRARAFLEVLRELEPGLTVLAEAEARGTHAIYLAYASDNERSEALDSLYRSGILVASTFDPSEQENSYDF